MKVGIQQNTYDRRINLSKSVRYSNLRNRLTQERGSEKAANGEDDVLEHHSEGRHEAEPIALGLHH